MFKIRPASLFFAFSLSAALASHCIVTSRSAPTTDAGPSTSLIPLAIRNYTAYQPNSLTGIQIHDSPQTVETLPLLQFSKTAWVRIGSFRWDLIEPVRAEPVLYDWNAVPESLLSALGGMNTRVIGSITMVPAWARTDPDYGCGPIDPAALPEFSEFLTALVTRYSQPPYNIHYWEIGNEPDAHQVAPYQTFGCWGDPTLADYGASKYAEMLASASLAIRNADPEAQIVLGGLLLGEPDSRDNTMGRFFSGILDAGGGDDFDIVNFHAYDYYGGSEGVFHNSNWTSHSSSTGPSISAKAAWLRSIMQIYGISEKPLINTENGLLFDGETNETFELTKAYYVAQAMASSKAAGLSGNIWYSWFGWRNSGLVNSSDLAKRPALDAFRFSSYLLGGAEYTGPVTANEISPENQVLGYRFRNNLQSILLVWPKNSQPTLVTITEIPSSLYNVFGESLPVSGNQILLPAGPMYILWPV